MLTEEKNVKNMEKIGVVIGRFQTPVLHKAHMALLGEVGSRHQKVLVFLGVSPVVGSRLDPLDFESRKIMIQEKFPLFVILPIKDMRSDAKWSRELDGKIKEIYPLKKAVLYGGRDCFIKNYSGQFEVSRFEQLGRHSATEERQEAAGKTRNSEDWRAGVIYGIYNQYEKAVMCADVALTKDSRQEIILGKRNSEDRWRFFGGHVHPMDENLEYRAKTELLEEAGRNIEVSDLEYAGSFRVDDWRYQKNCDKIMTVLFVADYLFGNLEAGDDIDEVRSFDIKCFSETAFLEKNLVEEHFPLMKRLIYFLRKGGVQCKDMKE